MKTTRILIIILLFSAVSFGQQKGKAPLGVGNSQLNFGLGLSGGGFPVYCGWEIAVHKDVTLGPEAQLIFLSHSRGSYIIPKFGADYHWNALIGIPSNWDFYAGADIGYRFYFGNYYDNNRWGHGEGIHLGLRIGGRWYWSDRWGLNLEFGGGSGYGGKLGLSLKL